MIQELDEAYIAHTYARFPVTLVSGKGARLYDDKGKEYIDMGAGIAVNTFGAADGAFIEAVTAQLHRLQHASNLYYTEPCARLAETLCRRTGMKRVFFSNSGAEANECAIKAARKAAFMKYGDEAHATIITLKNSFHGRTITTLSATGQDAFHTAFGPFTAVSYTHLQAAIKFGELVYFGQWFTPLREALSAFVDKTQQTVTGEVRLKLYKGNIIGAGVSSPYSLYDPEIATFDEDEVYNQADSAGFINLFGLPLQVRAKLNEKNKQ